jgi:hypothetical protein
MKNYQSPLLKIALCLIEQKPMRMEEEVENED